MPRDQSLLHNLMAARRKDTGEPLSDAQICAQSFTFILAGGSPSPRRGVCSKHVEALCTGALAESQAGQGLTA